MEQRYIYITLSASTFFMSFQISEKDLALINQEHLLVYFRST